MPRFEVTFNLPGAHHSVEHCTMQIDAPDAHTAQIAVENKFTHAEVTRVEQIPDTPRYPLGPRFTLGKPYWPAFSKMEVRDVFDRGQRMGTVLGPQEEADAMLALLNELP